jgi:hypothetical protein
MRTIETIIPQPLTPMQLDYAILASLYNGIGTEDMNLDDIIDLAIKKIPHFDKEKRDQLELDLEQLACRHDIEWRYKLGFYRSNIRLAYGVWRLFHWAGGWTRIVLSFGAFSLVTFSSE